jgi:hypothetical protein
MIFIITIDNNIATINEIIYLPDLEYMMERDLGDILDYDIQPF